MGVRTGSVVKKLIPRSARRFAKKQTVHEAILSRITFSCCDRVSAIAMGSSIGRESSGIASNPKWDPVSSVVTVSVGD